MITCICVYFRCRLSVISQQARETKVKPDEVIHFMPLHTGTFVSVGAYMVVLFIRVLFQSVQIATVIIFDALCTVYQ